MRRNWSLLVLAGALTACNGKDDDDDDDNVVDDTGDGGSDLLCEPADLACEDAIILDLSLHDDKVSDGEVSTVTEGADYLTYVDATAGGYNQAANNPWVYVKFTTDGASRVDIDDETALESMDWDMAFRRFIIRLNSGDSGPSCVGVSTERGEDYDAIDSVPEGTTYDLDWFYDGDCSINEDGSGLPDSPEVALGYGEWWQYTGCVATTLTPQLIQLADGHVMKMVVETYYDNGQDDCNSSGSTSGSGGNINLRWQMLQ